MTIIRGAVLPRQLASSTSRLAPTTTPRSWNRVNRASYRSYTSQNNSSFLSSGPRLRSRPSQLSSLINVTPSNSYSSRRQSKDDSVEMAENTEPSGCIATEGIELFTLQTPNGYKASIVLEELKEAYGDKAPKYTTQVINISKNTQKEEWFTNICPNGRIPAIVDHERGDFPVFEGLAILSYLTKHYDPDNKISFPYDSDDHSVAEQWMSWQHGGVGPMQGQANHFVRYAKEKIPYAAQRYVGEAERLYGILDARLSNRDFVVGAGRGRFSIADISLLGWANAAGYATLDIPGLFPNVAAWLDRCLERPGVARGFAIPVASPFANKALKQKLQDDEEARKAFEETKKFVDEAKAKYGYKYASP